MRFQFALYVILPAAVSCLPFVDIIEPDQYPDYIIPKFDQSPERKQSGKADACNWPAFQACFDQFIADASLDRYNVENATYLINSINTLLADAATQGGAQGATNALFKLCRAQQVFFGKCLGLDQATQCMSAIEYIRQGISSNNGFSYQLLFTRLNFQCGVALTAYIPQAMVVAQTSTALAASLGQCSTTFIQNLLNSTYAPYCGVMETYTECVGKIYTVAAQGDLDFGWTVCEAYRLANIITLPGCTDSQWACKLGNLQ